MSHSLSWVSDGVVYFKTMKGRIISGKCTFEGANIVKSIYVIDDPTIVSPGNKQFPLGLAKI